MDIDFDQFLKLTSTEDIQEKGTVRVIIPSEQPAMRHMFSWRGWHWHTFILWVNHLNFNLILNLVTKMSRLATQLPYSSLLPQSKDAAVKGKPGIPCWIQTAEPKFQSQVRHFAGLGFQNNEVHNRISYLCTIRWCCRSSDCKTAPITQRVELISEVKKTEQPSSDKRENGENIGSLAVWGGSRYALHCRIQK